MIPPKRALLVIDVQNEYVTGAMRIEYPPVDQSLGHIRQAMTTARAAGIPIIAVQHLTPAQAPVFARGSDGAALHSIVVEQGYDVLIEKTLASAFAGTQLAQWLRDQAIDTLTVVGYMTHNCNDATIREAYHAGWKVEFLHDAAGSVPYANAHGMVSAEEIHRLYCVVLHTGFAAVVTTQEWQDAVKEQRPLVADGVYSSYQRAVELRQPNLTQPNVI